MPIQNKPPAKDITTEEQKKNLLPGNIVLFGGKQKLGKGVYRLCRVVETEKTLLLSLVEWVTGRVGDCSHQTQ